MKRLSFSLIILFIVSCFSHGQQDDLILQHESIISFTLESVLEIKATTSGPVEAARFFYRHKGIEEFQVRNLDLIEEKTHLYYFDTSQLPTLDFEYYLSAVIKDKEVTLPQRAPASYFYASGESLEPIPEVPEEFPDIEDEAKKFKVRFPVNVMGSVQTTVKTQEEYGEEKQVDASGNLRVSAALSRGNTNANLDSNFSYTNVPYGEESNIDISDMMLVISRGNHMLSAGDININESEFTVYGLGRRGVEYTYRGNKTSVYLFDVSSQQYTGFKGFGIPKSQISIIGGSVGYRFFKDMVSLKAIYLSGKDDPSLGVNIGYDYFNTKRQGRVFAIVEEANLFQNSLTIQGEYARSNYDGNLEDEKGSVSDDAWRMGVNFSKGIFSIGGRFQCVGDEFNPIGHQYFTNDRKGYDANIGFNFGRINIMGAYISSNDNVSSDPSTYTTKNDIGNLNLMWAMTDKVSLNLGYRRNSQDTSCENGEQIFMQDSLSDEISGSMALNLSQSVNINLSVVNSIMSSQNNPDMDTSNLTVNLGGSLRFKQFLSLMPSLGYSQNHDKFSDEKMQTVNAFISGELSFIAQVLTTSFSGSFTYSDSDLMGNSTAYNLSSNLNIYLNNLLKTGNFVLSLRGNYNRTEMSDYTNSYYSLMAQLDFSI